MSMLLTAKAMDLQVGNPIRKLVLLKLADQANDKGECWPSYATIAKAAECSRTSAVNHIKSLEKQGFLWVEERVIGKSQNLTNIYHLTLEKGGTNAELGGGTNAEPEPINKNQSMNHSNAHAEACAAAPDDKPAEKTTAKRRAKNRDADDLALLTEYGVSVQTAEDYLTIRKAKRLPLTKTALLQIQAEANKAGLTVEQALVYAIGNGWASFRAEWLQNRMGNAAKTNEPSHRRFADKTTTPATTPAATLGMRPLGKM